tara:strand:+ start:334 stop:990 length:657 start_codon:yes stop_codon:yes gene_type:complete
MTNKVTIEIRGYGGEFVLGSMTKEQYDYWKEQGREALKSYAYDAFDYVTENKIPKEMDFMEGRFWYDFDDMEHFYGCDLENAWIDITLPDGSTQTHDNAYKIREEERDEDTSNNIREISECYTTEGVNNCYPSGFYFTAYSSEKGQFIYTELELPEGHDFDGKRLVFWTIDLDGSDFLDSISYVMPKDDPTEPTELTNEGGSTTGKGWECSVFQITNE